ncbi:MAG: hypothetical protein HFG75_01480 [Hungatella sp.]|nr:hypothetical protein [Hungatella sp.]
MAVKKAADTKIAAAETVKEEKVKKTAAKKPAVKKEASKEEAVQVKEEAPKKETVKKAAAKKTAEPKATVTVQYQGKNIVAADVLEAAKKAFAEANPDVEIETIDLYVKPEDGAAYYAVNGQGSEDYKVEL